MATITSNATGNWSSGGTWVGGVKPQAGDDVLLTSTHVVTLDENPDFASLSFASGAASGCYVLIPAGSTRVITGAIGWGSASNSPSRLFYWASSAGTPTVVTINGNLTKGGPGDNKYLLEMQGQNSAVLTVNGNIVSGAMGGSQGHICMVTGGGGGNTITVNGNITGPTAGTGAAFWVQAQTAFNVNGNITGASSAGMVINYNGTPTQTFTMAGNITTGAGAQWAVMWTGPVAFTGAITMTGGTGHGLFGGQGTYTIAGGLTHSGTGQALAMQPAIGTTATMTCSSVVALNYNAQVVGLYGAGTCNVTCPTLTGPTGGSTQAVYCGSNNQTVVWTGDIAAGAGNANCFYIGGAGCAVTINGNVTGGSGGASARGVNIGAATCTVTINGNVTGGTNAAPGGYVGGSGTTLAINGVLMPGAGGSGISMGSVAYNPASYYATELKGGSWNGTGTLYYAVDQALTLNFWRCKKVTAGSAGALPVYGIVKMTSDTANNRATFCETTSGSVVLVDVSAVADVPAIANVRLGTAYSLGAKTGTLAVPSPSAVSQGVATDNAVGTAILTQANVQSALASYNVATGVGVSAAEQSLEVILNQAIGYIDTEVSAIKAKTDLLPGDPAAASEVATAIAASQTALAATIGALHNLSSAQAHDAAESAALSLGLVTGSEVVAAVEEVLAAIGSSALSPETAQQSAEDALLAFGAALEVSVQAVRGKTDALPSDPADQSILLAAIGSGGVTQEQVQDAAAAALTAYNAATGADVTGITIDADAIASSVWTNPNRTLTMTPRQLYQAQQQGRLALVRGDGFYQQLLALGAMAEDLIDVVLTVKRDQSEADDDAILQMSAEEGVIRLLGEEPNLSPGDPSGLLVTDRETGGISIRLSEELTALLPDSRPFGTLYVADIQYEYDGGGRYTPVTLAFSVTPDITRR